MRMSQPYVGRPNDYGILVTTQDKLNDAVLEAHARRLSGRRARQRRRGHRHGAEGLRAGPAARSRGPTPRHRIEHCTLVNPDLLKRIAAIGAIPTPFYTYVYYHGDKWAQYGDERVRWMFAHRSFLDHGIRVAGASDYVPGPFEPLMAIQSMVTRTRLPRPRLGREPADHAWPRPCEICTLHGAYASFEETDQGLDHRRASWPTS